MKHPGRTLMLCVSALAIVAGAGVLMAQKAYDWKKDGSLSQGGMTAAAAKEWREADDEMNKVYKAVLAEHGHDPRFVARLKAAQKAWLQFRDLHLESYYPVDEPGAGSVRPMCAAMEMTAVTKARTEQLRYFIEGEEGDVCVPAGARPE